MKKYKQTRPVDWIKDKSEKIIPAGTIWIENPLFDKESNEYYITPEDENLRTTPFGVDLQLLSEEEWDLFESIS